MTSYQLMRINELNHWLFNFVPSRWIGRYIYDWQRRHQLRTQSTSTKFFRNLQQLAALEGPLANLIKTGNLSVLVAGCSYGCEAYSLGGLLALRFPRLNWRITAVDISHEALKIADAARYTSQHGLGSPRDNLEKQLEARLFKRSGDEWTVVADIRERVSFAYSDVLSAEFRQFKNYDLVLGQNFMIHMDDASAKSALASLVAAARPGGALFLGGMDLETKTSLLAPHQLVPVDWNIVEIHEGDNVRRLAWPWNYWSLEPIHPHDRNYLTRYSTIFLKP
jgi:chemotaxis methyl-accepting protein methylase